MSDRIRVMKDSLKVALEHPILGIGYGRGRLKEALRENYKDTANERSPIWHSHNVYIELFAETGVLGLGVFMAPLGCSISNLAKSVLRARDHDPHDILRSLGSFDCLYGHRFGDVPFYHHETRIFSFTLVALIHLHSRGNADTLDGKRY